MRFNSYLLITLSFTFCYLFTCCEDKHPDSNNIVADRNPFKDLQDTFTITDSLYDILLLKDKDCISCEMVMSEYLSDTTREVRTYIILEDIREVERGSLYESKPFLRYLPHTFNSTLISDFCQKIKMNFTTSIILRSDKNNQILWSEYFRDHLASGG